MISQRISDAGLIVSGGRDSFMEVMDTASRMVWMSASAVNLLDYESLEVGDPLIKSGLGRAAMDRAAFTHSPGTPDGAVRERVVGGHLFINVATPSAPIPPIPPKHPGGPMAFSVDKAHVLIRRFNRHVRQLGTTGDRHPTQARSRQPPCEASLRRNCT
jgi:hypothetical protein